MTSFQTWSTTAASNTSVGGKSIAEGMNPSDVNDAMRGLMAELAGLVATALGAYTGTVGGTADAITLTPNVALVAYASGNLFLWKASGANTVTGPTINVSGLGAKTIKLPGGSALAVGQWATNDMILGCYNGTDVILISNLGASAASLYSIFNALTEDTSPDANADYQINIDASASALKKQKLKNSRPTEVIAVALGDETTALTTGTGKFSFRMPFAMTLTSIKGSLSVAQTSGSIVTIDVNEAGSTIMTTNKITFDNTEKTTATAATAPALTDTSLADDAEITFDIDQVGDGTAKGAKVYLIGYRT